jgi:hypothetical protein
MKKKRIILIVSGIFLISAAVVIGVNIFTLQTDDPLKDEVISDCHTLAALAQKYWNKPVIEGGGGNSFSGWAIPVFLDTTAYGSYSISVAGSKEGVQITGTPHDSLGCDWIILTDVTPDDVSSTVVSNP